MDTKPQHERCNLRRVAFRYGGSLAVLCMVLIAGILNPAQAQKGPPPHSQATCKAAGGRWAKAGLLGVEQCDVRTSDAGALCNDDNDCESACVTGDDVAPGTPARGRCYERSLSVGRCLNYVTGGVATGVVCKD